MAVILSHRRPDWYPTDWKEQTVVIVASGPSAVDAPLELAIGRAKFVAVNDSWRLCPWLDLLIAVDYQWWETRKGCLECPAPLKVSVDGRVKHFPSWGVKYLQCNKPTDELILDRVGTIGWGGNSGFCALNMVAQLQPRRILLVGYDMCFESIEGTEQKRLHWHRLHGKGLSNPTVVNVFRWRKAVDNAATALEKAGIVTINCSLVSALRRYPKMAFEDALDLIKGDANGELYEADHAMAAGGS